MCVGGSGTVALDLQFQDIQGDLKKFFDDVSNRCTYDAGKDAHISKNVSKHKNRIKKSIKR